MQQPALIFSRVLFDLRFALRLLRRSPGFTFGLLSMLVLGIASTTAMFSLVESLLLRPLPFPRAEELGVAWSGRWDGPEAMSMPDFQDWRHDTTSLSHVTAVDNESYSVSIAGAKPVNVSGAAVSGDFFPMFELPPLMGRLLGEDDCSAARSHVAVISANLWRSRFGADPSVVGRAITIDSKPFTIIGVAANGFRFVDSYGYDGDLWVPLLPAEALGRQIGFNPTSRGDHFLKVLTRRRTDVTDEQAAAQFFAVGKSLEQRYPETNTKRVPTLHGLREALVRKSKNMASILFAAVAFVYLVMCANVANLLLARTAARRGEMAMRAALGATRRELLRQVVLETLVLFAAGATIGAFLARWLIDLFSTGVVTEGAHLVVVGLDPWAFSFSAGLSVVSGVTIGIYSAFAASRAAPHDALKETAARASGGAEQGRLRALLVVLQVAVAFALLVGSGVALRAFTKRAATPLGYDIDAVLVAGLHLPEKYSDEDQVLAFARSAIDQIAREPGVESVSLDSSLPLVGSNRNSSFEIEGRPRFQRGDQPIIENNAVMPGFFKTMGIPVLRGRDITAMDERTARRVILVNQGFVDHFFPGGDGLGQRISWDDDDWREIVGVVGDTRRDLSHAPYFEAYAPLAQCSSQNLSFVIRTRTPETLARNVRSIFFRVDALQALSRVDRLAVFLGRSLEQERWAAALLGAFSLAALVLAALGLFGLVSYSTSRRTRELGIRMALGSSPAGVVRLVMRGGLALLGVGLTLGLGGALAVGRLLAERIPDARPFDLVVYTAIPLILGIAGLLACVLPAWRAVRIPPSVALRYE
jgi:predicted permease